MRLCIKTSIRLHLRQNNKTGLRKLRVTIIQLNEMSAIRLHKATYQMVQYMTPYKATY